MIFLTREAELIIKYRNNDMSEAEIMELCVWLHNCEANLLLFLELTDDDHLREECGVMMEGKKEGGWKELEQRLTVADDTRLKGKKRKYKIQEKAGAKK